MNKIALQYLTLCLTFFTLGGLTAQNADQEFSIPLTEPGKPGKLIVNIQNGVIAVEGHSGKEVLVTMKPHSSYRKDHSSRSKAGLRRIPNNALSFEVTESNNKVRIEGNRNTRTDFLIKVPQKFALVLHTHHNGDVKVSNVAGEIEVNSHHGGIWLDQISGSVIADTHHGEISAKFDAVDVGQPMAFSTYHGDVDITFPSNVVGTTKIKTEKGDIFTDFDIEMSIRKKEEPSRRGGVTKIFGGWLYGDLGKGGPEFMFNTYHGDVILRKK